MNLQKGLLERIEKKRGELYDTSSLDKEKRVLDSNTYKVSLELDRLIIKYMKNR